MEKWETVRFFGPTTWCAHIHLHRFASNFGWMTFSRPKLINGTGRNWLSKLMERFHMQTNMHTQPNTLSPAVCSIDTFSIKMAWKRCCTLIRMNTVHSSLIFRVDLSLSGVDFDKGPVWEVFKQNGVGPPCLQIIFSLIFGYIQVAMKMD